MEIIGQRVEQRQKERTHRDYPTWRSITNADTTPRHYCGWPSPARINRMPIRYPNVFTMVSGITRATTPSTIYRAAVRSVSHFNCLDRKSVV